VALKRWGLAALLVISVALGVVIAGIPSRHQDRAIRFSPVTTTTSTALPSTTTTSATTLPSTTSTTPAPVSYVVKAGDTLSGIAVQFRVSVSAIASANGLSNPNVISVGQVFVIPQPGA
jgi:LysM repeat protein